MAIHLAFFSAFILLIVSVDPPKALRLVWGGIFPLQPEFDQVVIFDGIMSPFKTSVAVCLTQNERFMFQKRSHNLREAQFMIFSLCLG